jgi:RNA polymerase sigma-54 factor
MKLSLDLRTALTQTLTPQQIQYLKLLQLPAIQIEQQVLRELEQNPMLEEFDVESCSEFEEHPDFDLNHEKTNIQYETGEYESELKEKNPIDDTKDPFEFYKMLWYDSAAYTPTHKTYNDEDEDNEFFQIKNVLTIAEEILQQLRMTELSDEEIYLGEQIIGNVDNDGYLRRDINDIVDETNENIAELNFEIKTSFDKKQKKENDKKNNKNPAREFAISKEALNIAREISKEKGEIIIDESETKKIPKPKTLNQIKLIKPVTIHQAEIVLSRIRQLDPPGFASRSVRECLIAQCNAIPEKNKTRELALRILNEAYDAFAMKHYHLITKQLGINEKELKEAINIIKRLNPKPGGIETDTQMNSVIPDFIITREEDTNELLINVNDSMIPTLKLNKAYEKLKKEARVNVFNKETREWIRNKYEDAKFLIQAIKQRKNTMLKVMTAIAHKQKDFFYQGHTALKPLIYKDIAEETGLDISTVCRIVNGKYVQTEFGTLELKFFFSESLPSFDGQEISTTVIKQVIRDIINNEPKNKPLSDDKIVKELKEKGYQIARRTVAKYREQMKIPVARLRKEL